MPGEQNRLTLPAQVLFGDLNDLDCFGTDQLSIQMLIAQITDLLVKRIQFLHDLGREAYTLDDPVVAEVTESNRLLSSNSAGHGITDYNLLAENRIVGMIPDVIAIGILEGAECQDGFVVHHPDAVLAVFFLHGEVKTNDIIIGDGRSGYTDFRATFCSEDTRRSFLSIAINKGFLFGVAHTFGEGVDQVSLDVKPGIRKEILMDTDDRTKAMCMDRKLLEIVHTIVVCVQGTIAQPGSDILRVAGEDGTVAAGHVHDGSQRTEYILVSHGRHKLLTLYRRQRIAVGHSMSALGQTVVGGVLSLHGIPEASFVFG